MTKISVMPHTHWDREWYFNTSKSLMYSLHNFREAIRHLKENEEYKHFLLDGQVSIIEDYIKYYPEDEKLVRELILNNRLITGPWHTQTDLLVISGESIVRNLYYGIDSANKLGKSMMVGYVPDCFGQSAQMPQIYNGFGINKSAFRRGLAHTQVEKAEFYWNGPGDSKVFAHNIIDYGNMINPPCEEEKIEEYFKGKIEELGSLATANNILLMNGQDQRPIRKDLLEILDKARSLGFDIEISNLEDILEKMEAESVDTENYSGEFTFGQKSRVHKSIFSTRADLKIMNNKAENMITNILEPVCTIAYSLGQKYNHKVIEEIWKLMFENAAHDSIGMCNSDEVNDDVKNRYKKVFDLSDKLLEINQRLIAQSIEEKDIFQFQVYNMLPYKRSEVIKVTLFTPGDKFKIYDSNENEVKHYIINSKDTTNKIQKDSLHEIGVNGNYSPEWSKEGVQVFETEMYIKVSDIEPMGYNTLYFKNIEDNSCEEITSVDEKVENNFTIENRNYIVTLSKEGKIDITNKENNLSLSNIMVIEDSGDDGDTYDYSEPRQDNYYYSIDNDISNIQVSKNNLVETISYEVEMNIPKDLVSRAKNIKDSKVKINVAIELKQDSKNVDFKVKINNNAIEHRMRAVFKTDISSTNSIADQQFGSIKRPTYLEEVEIWEEENWVEKPRTLEPMQSYTTLNNDEYGVVVFTDCVREYQIVGEKLDAIALTLFRSTPFMGKGNLLDRPGRASGMEWETPDASLLKTMDFNLSLNLYTYKDENQLAIEAKELYTPLTAFQAPEFINNFEYFILNKTENRNLPENYSLFKFEGNNMVLSSLKKNEDKEGYIIRYFNGNLKGNKSDTLVLNNMKAVNINEVMLDEKTIIKELNEKEELILNAMPSQFKTLSVE